MRTTNNKNGVSSMGESEYPPIYAVFDTDTGEYLVEWDDFEDGAETWAELDFSGDYAADELDRIGPGAQCRTEAEANDLLKAVGEALCERFPDEQINLVVQRLQEVVTRSVQVEDWGQVQTFGEDEAAEDEEGELTPEPRSWTLTQSEDEDEDDDWKPIAPPPTFKAKKAKKARKSRAN